MIMTIPYHIIQIYIYIYIYVWRDPPGIRERGTAPKRGRHSEIFVPTECICAMQWQPGRKPAGERAQRSAPPRLLC